MIRGFRTSIGAVLALCTLVGCDEQPRYEPIGDILAPYRQQGWEVIEGGDARGSFRLPTPGIAAGAGEALEGAFMEDGKRVEVGPYEAVPGAEYRALFMRPEQGQASPIILRRTVR